MLTVALLVVALLALIIIGVPIAFAIGTVGTVGLYLVVGDRTLDVFSTFAAQSTTGFTLAAIPLFLLMGEFVYRSGLAQDVFKGMGLVTRLIPGSLLQANIATSAIFAATSGSSVASAAALSPMSFREEVVVRNYDRRLVLGSLAAGGTLGILIPPSGILIIYGVATSQSITELFAAGLIPGVCLALLYMLYIAGRALFTPSLAPAEVMSRSKSGRGRSAAHAVLDFFAGLVQAWPLLAIGLLVLVMLYGGFATPTESAALGAGGAFVLVTAKRRLTWAVLSQVLLGTARTTAMIFLLFMTAQVVTLVLAYYQVPTAMQSLAGTLGAGALLAFVVVTYLLLGLFFDGISIMVLTLPVVIPALMVAEYDLIWFGILAVILIEIGLLTPPVGLNLFVLQGATGADLFDVARGAAPFALIQFCFAIVLIGFPGIALWLPAHLTH